jgi:carboxymethylenebutenolidase
LKFAEGEIKNVHNYGQLFIILILHFMQLIYSIFSVWILCTTLLVPQRIDTPAPNPLAVMCHTEIKDMAYWANDITFQDLHPIPQEYTAPLMGKKISFKVKDGINANAYLVKARKKSKKWLFVYQEWWGLNDHIRGEADKYYTALGGDVNVMAIDMYDGKVTSDRTEAAKYMQGVQEARLESIVRGAQKYAGKKAQIGSIGWCFGGSWSLKSAIITGTQSKSCVIYYGMPVREVEKLKMLNCDVLGVFATEEYISKDVIIDFAAQMKTASKQLEYKIFPGVHGFANPSNPKHDVAATNEAFGMSVAHLKKGLGI